MKQKGEMCSAKVLESSWELAEHWEEITAPDLLSYTYSVEYLIIRLVL